MIIWKWGFNGWLSQLPKNKDKFISEASIPEKLTTYKIVTFIVTNIK